MASKIEVLVSHSVVRLHIKMMQADNLCAETRLCDNYLSIRLHYHLDMLAIRISKPETGDVMLVY